MWSDGVGRGVIRSVFDQARIEIGVLEFVAVDGAKAATRVARGSFRLVKKK